MKTTFISILSAKGGVGKTTSVVNLACALHIFGRDVLIVDGNYNKANVGLQLGINVDKTINHTLKAKEDILDVVYSHPSGIKLIPGSIVHEEIFGENHRKFEEILYPLKGKVETILLDSPPGFSEELIEVLNISDKAILVTTPDLPSITDTLRTKRFCKEKGVDILGVLVTHTSNSKHEAKIHEIETIFDEKVIGVIPFDENIKFSIKAKYPCVYANPRSKATIAYKKLASNLIGEPYEENLSGKHAFRDILKRLGF